MSFPQPDSDSAVLSGFDFFRLNTPLVSPGDIYESLQGSHSVIMGPESDLSQIRVNYYNATRRPTGAYVQPSFIDSAIITPQRGFVGQLVAHNTDSYQPSNRPGRILFSPANLYDPSYTATLAPVDQMLFIAPVLDVIQYFGRLPSVTPERNDKEYYFQDFQFGVAAGVARLGLVIPYYGRKYAYVQAVNRDAISNLSIEVFGVNYAILPAPTSGDEISLGANLAIAPGAKFTQIVRASVNGEFDALLICIGLATTTQTETPLRIRVSDNEE